MTAGPLHGVRVLEFSQVVAGPTCGRALAELGAHVIKVEPPEGDPYRNTGTVIPNEGKRFQSLNLGKRSIVIDLRQPEGQQLAQRLATTVDVVITNYRHGVSERLGIDWETLSTINPALIYCRLTGFGTKSKAATWAATDPMMAGYSGLMVGGGKIDEEGLPQTLGAAAIADVTTGYVAAMATCAALYARRETGQGQLIDASLLRSSLAVQDTTVMREPVFDATQRDPMVEEIERIRLSGGKFAEMLAVRDRRRGATMTLRFYSGAYQAKDGVIMLGALTPKSRAAAREVLGITDDPTLTTPDDPTDPEYLARLDALKRYIRDTIAEGTIAEWSARFQEAGCPVAPVNFPEMMSNDEVVSEEGIMWDLVNDVTGPQRVVGPVVEMSGTPTRIQGPSPQLGRHTRQVLADAGVSEDQVAALLEAGVIRNDA